MEKIQNREELFDKLEDLFAQYFVADARTEIELKDEIFKTIEFGKHIDLTFELRRNQVFR